VLLYLEFEAYNNISGVMILSEDLISISIPSAYEKASRLFDIRNGLELSICLGLGFIRAID